jgi:gliding motility-associated-like protein
MNNLRLVFLLAFCFLASAAAAHQRPAVEYVENRGQWDQRAHFRGSLGAGNVYLEPGRFAFSFLAASDLDAAHEFSRAPRTGNSDLPIRGHAWFMEFVGAQHVIPEGVQLQPHYYSFFLGSDPDRWASAAQVFGGVKYRDIYPGIDLLVHQGSGNFKYDFRVEPGVSPDLITLEFEGTDGMELRDGQLILRTSIGEFIENRPYAFQVTGGQVTEVACRYVLDGNVIRFAFPEGYDETIELVVDPELIASTLSGASGASNYGHSATFDIAGNIYTGCISFGAGYPTTSGAFDTSHNGATDFGLSKLSPDGSQLLWATYIGGSSGEYPHSLWATDQGELFAYGSSSSPNFPTTSGAYDTSHNGGVDIVVVKVSSDGTQLLGSTFIGGTSGDGQNSASVNYGDNYRGEIILDLNGKVMITSCSSSADFPVTPGAFQPALAGLQDAVFCRLNSTLTALEVSTYIGSSGNDMGFGLRMNSAGNVYIAGMAGGANFPLTPGAYQSGFLGGGGGWNGGGMDGFVVRLNGNATILQRSTLLATTEGDQCFFIDLDNDENVFVYGQGGDFPVVGTVYSNPGSKQFITKLNADLTSVMLSTVVGSGGGWGGYDFVPDAFLVDVCNNIYISSYQASGSLPTTGDALYTTGGFYLAVFSEELEALEYGTFYTGNHVDGGTSRFDKNGTVYQAVCSGGGFATTPDAWATTQSTGWDIAVFKIDFDVSGVNSAITVPDLSGCAPYEAQFQNFSVGNQFFWDFGDGGTSTEFEPLHVYEEPGVYTVMMIASDEMSCNLADTATFVISISTPVDYYPSFQYEMDCATMTVTTTNTTGYDFLDYIWDMGDGTVLEADNVSHVYNAPGEYEVTLLAIDNGCESDEEATQTVVVFNEVVAVIPNADAEGCAPFPVSLTATAPGALYTWDFGDGSPPVSGNSVSHTYTLPGSYTLTLSAEGTDGCTGYDEATSLVVVIAPPPIDAAFDANQINDCVLLQMEGTDMSTGDGLSYLWNFGDGMSSQEQNVAHTYSQPGNYTVTLTVTEPVCGTSDQAIFPLTLLGQLDLSLPPNRFICYYEESTDLSAVDPGPGTTYLWSTGETSPSIEVSTPGVYAVTAFFNNCSYTHEVELSVGPERPVFRTLEFCEGSNQYLEIPAGGGSWYSWCTGETTQGITIQDGGEYCFEYADENGCLQEGHITATLNAYSPSVFIPNAFTPDGDGMNDAFRAEGDGIREFELTVWNRWGDEIFRSADIQAYWDGSWQGQEHYVQNEVYTYQVKYRGECNPEKVEKVGYVTLIR